MSRAPTAVPRARGRLGRSRGQILILRVSPDRLRMNSRGTYPNSQETESHLISRPGFPLAEPATEDALNVSNERFAATGTSCRCVAADRRLGSKGTGRKNEGEIRPVSPISPFPPQETEGRNGVDHHRQRPPGRPTLFRTSDLPGGASFVIAGLHLAVNPSPVLLDPPS